MNKEKILEFFHKYSETNFYQPIIFDPGILEIKGKWHTSTLDLSKQILDDIQGKTLLDVGCNIGFFLFEALRRGAQSAVGIDSDPNVISKLKQIRSLLKLSPTAHCIDALNYTPDQIFDTTLLLNVAQFTSDPQSCFSLYRNHTKLLYVEHDLPNEDWFTVKPIKQSKSQRAGGRILSVFAGSANI